MRAQITLSDKALTPKEVTADCLSIGLDPMLLLDSQDLEPITDHFGTLGRDYDLEKITAALVAIDNGDYSRIYVSWDSAPYYVTTKFYRVDLDLI